jgi:parallel beta-helix repeat protein
MQTRFVLRKWSVVSIILLFVGLAITPSINSNKTIFDEMTNPRCSSIHSADSGTLSGYVTDSAMNPIEGARVRVYFHETYREYYSDGTGYYHVTDIPICYCMKNATCSKEGYYPTWVLLSIGENTTHDFVLTQKGHWLYVGGSGPNNYTKIQDAIDNASTGDTVFVFPGTYPENLVVDKTINVIGQERNTTIIDGGEHGSVVFIEANETTITEFTIRNSGEGFEHAGVSLLRSTGCTIRENIITSNQGNGILSLLSGKNAFLSNTVISNNYYGFNIRESDTTFILYNTVIGNTEAGIVAVNSNCTIIDFNLISNTTYEGIGLWSCNGAIVSNNTITQTNFAAVFLYFSTRIILMYNELQNNNQYGLLFDNSSYNTIYGNVIRENIQSGIEIDPSSQGNLICYNNLINNSINAHDKGSNKWNREYPGGGNYWSDYAGSDTLSGPQQDTQGADGIIDTQFNISGDSNQDHYPLKDPFGRTQLTFMTSGGFGLSGTITNVGNKTAFLIHNRITADGKFVFIGRDTWREIPKPLLPGQTVHVKSPMIFGFGKIFLTIALWADNAPYISGSYSATLLLFFIVGVRLGC